MGTVFVLFTIAILLSLTATGQVGAFAQSHNEPKIEIWSEDSQITQAATSPIVAHICPSPVPDTENITRYSEVGEALYPGTFSVSYYGIRPDGSEVAIGRDSYDQDMCDSRTGTSFDTPDTYVIGNWTIYATVTWVSGGEIVSIKSNEISVLVKPSVLQPLEPKLLTDKPELDPLLDWSPDGKYILGVANSPAGRTLALMDADTLEVTRLQAEFDQIYNARFSPSGEGIVILAAEKSFEPVQVVYYSLSDNSIKVVAEDPSSLTLNSAVWLEHVDGDVILYGKMASVDGKTTGYDIWTVRSDGSDAARLYNFALAEDERMWVYDSNGDKLLLKKTRPLGMPITESEIIVFDVYTKESIIVWVSGDDGGGPLNPRFSPSRDFILFDDGPGYHVQGGPIILRSIDGNVKLSLLTGQPELGTDPTSFVISPDGRYLVALMTGGEGHAYTKTEFAHPMPEFGQIAGLLTVGMVSGIVLITHLHHKHKS